MCANVPFEGWSASSDFQTLQQHIQKLQHMHELEVELGGQIVIGALPMHFAILQSTGVFSSIGIGNDALPV